MFLDGIAKKVHVLERSNFVISTGISQFAPGFEPLKDCVSSEIFLHHPKLNSPI